MEKNAVGLGDPKQSMNTFAVIMNDLNVYITDFKALNERLKNLANEIYGPEPEKESIKNVESLPSSTLTGKLQNLNIELSAVRLSIQKQIERLED